MTANPLSACQSVRLFWRMLRVARRYGSTVPETCELMALGYLTARHHGSPTERLYKGQAVALARRIAIREMTPPVPAIDRFP